MFFVVVLYRNVICAVLIGVNTWYMKRKFYHGILRTTGTGRPLTYANIIVIIQYSSSS